LGTIFSLTKESLFKQYAVSLPEKGRFSISDTPFLSKGVGHSLNLIVLVVPKSASVTPFSAIKLAFLPQSTL